MRKRLISLAWCVGVLLSLLTAGVSASGGVAEGAHGDNITWTLSDNGCLSISGSGKMDETSEYPWHAYQDVVTTCVIGEGITNIPSGAFRQFTSLTHVELPVSLTNIYSAFSGCTNIKTVRYAGPSSSWRDIYISSSNKPLLAAEVIAVGDSLFAGGDGSEESPYQIATAQQLDNVRTALSGCFIQVCDIDLSNRIWQPIGSEDNKFTGSYDGGGYTISGLTMTGEYDASKIGMWGYVSTKGALHDIHVENCDIIIDDSTISKFYGVGLFIGGIVAYNEGSIEQCSIDGSIVVSTYDTRNHRITIGGISGQGICTNCINYVDIDVVNMSGLEAGNSSNTSCGGITGASGASYCVNYGMITASNTDFLCLGGISGSPNQGLLEFCANFGDISGTTLRGKYFSDFDLCSVGGIVGVSKHGTVRECVNYGNIKAYSLKCGSSSAGGVAGGSSGTILNSYNLAQMIDSLGQKKIEEADPVEYEDEFGNEVGRILGYRRGANLENNYAVDTARTNGNEPKGNIGLTETNGASITWEDIVIASAYILSAIEDPAGSVENFDRYVYQANSLQRTSNGAIEELWKELNEETYCHRMLVYAQDNGLDFASSMWDGCALISDALDDITNVGQYVVGPKDVYTAVIMNALEDGIENSTELVNSEYKKKIKRVSDFIASVCDSMQAEYTIDVRNENAYKNLTPEQQLKLSELTEAFFKEEYSTLVDATDLINKLSKGIEIAGNIEDYFERIVSCVQVAQLSNSMQTVVEQAYRESLKGRDPYLRVALADVIQILKASDAELIAKLTSDGFAVVGNEAIKYLIGEVYWEPVKMAVYTQCPVVAVIQAVYKESVWFTNEWANTDAIIEQYTKMMALVEIESVFASAHDTLRAYFLATQTTSAAKVYLSAVDVCLALLQQDCDEALTFIEKVDAAWIDQILGRDYTESINSIELRKSRCGGARFDIHTAWIFMLEEDYPGTGLFETYYSQLDTIYKQLLTKRYVIACPVDVYVYDEYDNMIAYAANGRASNSLDLTVVVDGDQKTLWFHDNGDYHVEYVGNDAGTMDITVTEYDETGSTVRSTNLYDVPLETGKIYGMNTTEQDENVPSYELKGSEDTVIAPDYDSIGADLSQHILTVESGGLNLNGKMVQTAKIAANETVSVTAYVPTGYQFLYWEASVDAVVFGNVQEASTTVRMLDQDLKIWPVVEEIGTNGLEIAFSEEEGYITAQLTNETAMNTNVKYIIGVYDTDGKMQDTMFEEKSLEVDSQMELVVDCSKRTKPVVIKAFVLDAKTLIPLRAMSTRMVY